MISTLEETLEDNPNTEILIEADSTLEPIAVAELFYLDGENGEPPDERFEIASVISVVDVRHFWAEIESPSSLLELDLQYDGADERTSADVVMEQIEFSDVVVLNRATDFETDFLNKTRALISWLNPRAQILETPPEGVSREFVEKFWRACELVNFDFDEAAEGAGWIQLLANTHIKDSHGTSISGLTIRGRRPLHPTRFKEFLDDLSRYHVVRAKGWIWIATRNGETGVWSVAGASSSLAVAGAWMAATPMREWPEDPVERDQIMADWVAPYGDRRQEISIIGFDLNELELRRAFKACMLSDEEFALGPEQWAKWNDPLPDWTVDSGDDFDGLLQ